MNDTHGQQGEGWIGFDLDGTLAKYDKWEGIDHIGEPVGPMVDLMKKLHADGKKVKILTARIAPHKLEDGTVGESYITVPDGEGGATKQYASQYIRDWCHFNLGFVPEIVYQKDHLMLDLYDDRCHQVIPNTGIPVETLMEAWCKHAIAVHKLSRQLVEENGKLRWGSRLFCAFIGAAIVFFILCGVEIYLWRSVNQTPEAELKKALETYLEVKAHEPFTQAIDGRADQ